MTTAEKLAQLKLFLDISGTAKDSLLTAYLSASKDAVLDWMYSGNTPETVTDVPARYEAVQIQAVITGYSMRGMEGQEAHSENATSRTFKHEDMIAYIRSNIMAHVGVY